MLQGGRFVFQLAKTTGSSLVASPGPPFTHQQTPRKMVYYGQTSCEQDTERYLDVVKYVFSSYKKEMPLVINTMGWVKGEQMRLFWAGGWKGGHGGAGLLEECPELLVFLLLPAGEGLLLLIDIIRLLSPTHIVQMDVYDWKAMAPLTPEYVHLTPGLYTKGKQQPRGKQLGTGGAETWSSSEGEGDASAPQYKLLYVHPEFPRAGVAGEA